MKLYILKSGEIIAQCMCLSNISFQLCKMTCEGRDYFCPINSTSVIIEWYE